MLRGVLVREVHQKRQVWWHTRRRRGRIAGIEYFTRGTFFDKKKTVRRVLITLPHLHGFEVLCDKVRVVNMGARDEEQMNSSFVW